MGHTAPAKIKEWMNHWLIHLLILEIVNKGPVPEYLAGPSGRGDANYDVRKLDLSPITPHMEADCLRERERESGSPR